MGTKVTIVGNYFILLSLTYPVQTDPVQSFVEVVSFYLYLTLDMQITYVMLSIFSVEKPIEIILK